MKQNNALVTFNDTDFGFSVRTLTDENGTAWFVGKDVAENLGYSNVRDALLRHVDNEDKIALSNLDESRITTRANGGYRDTQTMINESGVYSLIFSSKLPQAKEFKHWVTSKVLPDIRKYGMYMSDKVMNEMIEDSEKYKALMGMYVAERTKTKAFEENIKQIMPYAAIGKTVLSRPGSITVGECACFLQQHGLLPYGRNGLYKELRDKKLLCSTKERWNKPTEKGIRLGIVNLELDTDGNFVFSTKAMVTPEGLMKLAEEKFDAEYPLLALLKNTEKELQKAVGVNE